MTAQPDRSGRLDIDVRPALISLRTMVAMLVRCRHRGRTSGRGALIVVVMILAWAATPISGAVAATRASAPAVSLTWVGGHGAHWSAAANWSPAQVPATGDSLVFPATAPSGSVNDLMGLVLTDVSVQGHQALGGNSVGLTGGLISLTPPPGSTLASADVDLPLVLTLGVHVFGGLINVNGPISGEGGVLVTRTDSLPNNELPSFGGSAANTYTGDTTVDTGMILALKKAPGVVAVPSRNLSLRPGPAHSGTAGGILEQQPDQIADGTAIVGEGGPGLDGGTVLIEPSTTRPGVFDTVGSVTMEPGAGIVMFSGGLYATVLGVGDLNLRGAYLTIQTGGGTAGATVAASGAVDITGADLGDLGLASPPSGQPATIIAKDSPGPVTGTFAGLPEGWVRTVHPNRQVAPFVYRISYRGGDGNDVTLAAVAPDEALVRETYQSLLGRVPDDGGLVFWESYLAGGGARGSFTSYVANSAEGRTHTVRAAYLNLLGRDADPGGLRYWTTYVESGGPVDFMDAVFLGSAEYRSQPGHATTAGFLDALYRQATVLNRAPDGSGLAYWSDQIDRQGASATTVALAFGDSQESANVNVDRIFSEVLGSTPTEDLRTLYSAFYRQDHADAAVVTASVLAQLYQVPS